MSLATKGLYRFGEFELDCGKRTVTRAGERVALSPKAFEVLVCLVANPGRIISKDELMKAVWPDSFVEEGNLAQHISGLRKAMGDRADLIVTVPGRGYQFAAPVEQVAETALAEPERGGETVVQRVRERTRIVVTETALPALPAPATRTLGLTQRGWMAAVAAAAIMLAAVSIYLWKRSVPPPESRKVVVADFVNATGDPALDQTLKRALEIDLGQSPYLDVMGQGEAARTLQLMGKPPASALTPDVAKEVCVRTNRQVVLAGTIASVGREYLLTLQATDCNSSRPVAGAKAEAGSKEKILAALDSVAGRVRAGLGESKLSLESFQVPIEQATTSSLEALKAYSMGSYLNVDDSQKLVFFQKAIQLDPQFALAYSRIATVYYNNGEVNVATPYFQKAFDLSGHVSEKEKIRIQAHYYAEGMADLQKGIETYQLWASTYPNDWVPWVDLANDYTQLGQYPEAIDAAQHAMRISPDMPINYSVLARAYARANRFAEGNAVVQQAIQKKFDYDGMHGTLFDIAIAENDQATLAQEIKWGQDHASGWYGWFFPDREAGAAAAAGKMLEADALFRQSYDIAQHEYLPDAADEVLMDQATVQLAVDRPEAARATLAAVGQADRNSTEFMILQAQCGDASAAEHYLAAHSGDAYSGTVQAHIDLPRLRAALAMRKGKPLDAIAALEPATPYELATYEVLWQRAEAYRLAKQGEQAASEYQKILANPGIDPVDVLYPLAHLGLARALALQNKAAESRASYEKFFALWKDADADSPVLHEARLEYAHLQ